MGFKEFMGVSYSLAYSLGPLIGAPHPFCHPFSLLKDEVMLFSSVEIKFDIITRQLNTEWIA